jgi:hypothetical protein
VLDDVDDSMFVESEESVDLMAAFAATAVKFVANLLNYVIFSEPQLIVVDAVDVDDECLVDYGKRLLKVNEHILQNFFGYGYFEINVLPCCWLIIAAAAATVLLTA